MRGFVRLLLPEELPRRSSYFQWNIDLALGILKSMGKKKRTRRGAAAFFWDGWVVKKYTAYTSTELMLLVLYIKGCIARCRVHSARQWGVLPLRNDIPSSLGAMGLNVIVSGERHVRTPWVSSSHHFYS